MPKLITPALFPIILISATGISLAASASRGDQPTASPTKVAGDKQSPGPDAAKSPSATPSDSNRRTPHSSRVVFITAKDCPKCNTELARLNAPSGDFAWLRSGGWRIGAGPENHIQIVDRDAIPELVRKLAPREYPAVACIEDGEVVRSFKSGCTTPLDAWTFDWLAKGVNKRPAAPVLEAVRVESTGSYPLRGNHWSVEGDWNPSRDKVIEHLRGPNHVGYLQANWHIDAWSYEELRSLHDDLHERYGPWDTGGTASSTEPPRKWKGG
jgi:hypothetical protein